MNFKQLITEIYNHLDDYEECEPKGKDDYLQFWDGEDWYYFKKKDNSQETKSHLSQEVDELAFHSDSSPDIPNLNEYEEINHNEWLNLSNNIKTIRIFYYDHYKDFNDFNDSEIRYFKKKDNSQDNKTLSNDDSIKVDFVNRNESPKSDDMTNRFYEDKNPDIPNLNDYEEIKQSEYKRLKSNYPHDFHGFTARIRFRYFKKKNFRQENLVIELKQLKEKYSDIIDAIHWLPKHCEKEKETR
jgi:hypothetical protein